MEDRRRPTPHVRFASTWFVRDSFARRARGLSRLAWLAHRRRRGACAAHFSTSVRPSECARRRGVPCARTTDRARERSRRCLEVCRADDVVAVEHRPRPVPGDRPRSVAGPGVHRERRCQGAARPDEQGVRPGQHGGRDTHVRPGWLRRLRVRHREPQAGEEIHPICERLLTGPLD